MSILLRLLARILPGRDRDAEVDLVMQQYRERRERDEAVRDAHYRDFEQKMDATQEIINRCETRRRDSSSFHVPQS